VSLLAVTGKYLVSGRWDRFAGERPPAITFLAAPGVLSGRFLRRTAIRLI
jgi:hypothetical protein